MKRLEFNVALKTIGSYRKVGELRDGSAKTDLFVFRDIGLYLSSEGYAGIIGHFPLDLAMQIYRKYAKNRDFIVSGANLDSWGKDNIVVTAEDFDKFSFSESKVGKYMRYFYVKDVKMFMDILHTFDTYYFNNLTEKYDKLYEEENRRNIERLRMMSMGDYNAVGRIRTVANPLDEILLNLLEDFDDAVNPFQMEGIKLADYSEYSKRVQVNVDDIIDNNVTCVITDETGSQTVFTYANGESVYEVMTQVDIDNYVRLTHRSTLPRKDDAFSGNTVEILKSINGWASKHPLKGKTVYNLSAGMKISRGVWEEMTDEDRRTLEEEITMATSYACGVTMDNMMSQKAMRFVPQTDDKE